MDNHKTKLLFYPSQDKDKKNINYSIFYISEFI